MANLRPFRAPWTALVLVLVFPLMGQEGCDTCPQPPNLCQQYVWYAGSGECELRNRDDGEVCDEQGNPGVCTNGQCITGEPGECTGVDSFGICDAPVDGGLVGACVNNLCVLAAPQDQCLKVGVGRINCCSPQGCTVASGAYCTDPLDGVSCDPTGVEPPGQAGQDGTCENGTCVAQSGLCAGLSCPTSASDPCARDYCNTDVGQCEEFVVQSFEQCAASAGVDAVCHGGACIPLNDPGVCGNDACDDENACTIDLCQVLEDGVTFACSHATLNDGLDCLDGEAGECRFGRCQPVFGGCESDTDCDDGNPCTVNEQCNPFGKLCEHDVLADFAPCFGNGLCQNGACVPNLCEGRDCDDGNSCTGDPGTGEDTCIPPYGICSTPNLPDGTTCENNGQCFLGNCEPVIQPCSNDSQCDDGKSCTRNVCNGPLGCSFPRVANGQPCLDGEVGTCIFGNCSIGGP